MVQIFINCPICSKKGTMDIDENVITQNSRGITTISVSKVLCEHSFIAYIDNKFDVRDTFITDLTLESPELELDNLSLGKTPDQETINVFLITINLHPSTLTYILRACFNNEKVLLINNIEIVHKHLINFMHYIFVNTFAINFMVINRVDFQKNRKLFKDYLIIDDLRVLNDKNKVLKAKKFEVERNIVHSFFNEISPDISLNNIKKEIAKAFKLSNDVLVYVLNLDESEALDAKDLTKFLETQYNIKISTNYLTFLIDIVRNFYKVNVRDASDCLKFLWD
ncbi:MAG: hypothetical protein ACFFBP_06895 [Promethearchaeota archaeon]